MIEQYDRKSAVEYARKWALGRNPNFADFNEMGGDCTNFISQCLLAGGGILNYDYVRGWFYESLTKRSPSWTSVSYLQNFLLRKEKSVGPFGRIATIDEIEMGDIIQLRQNATHFNHTVIVTNKTGGNIYVSAHTNDALDKPLEKYYYKALMPIKILGIYS